MKKHLILLALLRSASCACAQIPGAPPPIAIDSAQPMPTDSVAASRAVAAAPASSALKKWLATGVHIRQNNNVATDVAQPAFLQLNWPNDAPRTFVAGVGALLDLPKGYFNNPALATSIALEYARNTTLKKEQHTFRAGLSATWLPLARTVPAPAVRPIIIFQGNYKHDAIKQDEALQASALFTAIAYFRSTQTGQRVTIFNGTVTDRQKRFFFLVMAPYVGLNFDHIYRAGSESATGTGSIVRVLGQFDVKIIPLPQAFQEKIELATTYVFRHDLADNTQESNQNHPYFKAMASYFPVNTATQSAGLSLAYVDGEDPTRGLERQQYWQLGLSLRLK